MPTVLLPPLPQVIERTSATGARRIRRALAMVGQGHAGALARLAFNRLVMPRFGFMVTPAATEQTLEAIRREEERRPWVILCSTADWSTPHRHRPQHLAEALARAGMTVFYVPARTGYDTLLGVRRLAPHLYLADLTVELLAHAERPVVILLSTDVRVGPTLLAALGRSGARLVYDYIDHFDAAVTLLPISVERRATHERLLRDDDVLVVASAHALVDEVRAVRTRNVALVANGVDCEHFSVPRHRMRFHAVFESALARNRPIVGYFGLLASWVDVELLAALAHALTDLSVVTIGADFDGAGMRLAAMREGNVFMVPSVSYDELPYYAAWFDVSVLPFRQSPVTDAASPLKLFEYMALGAPIVSTHIPESARYQSVMVAQSPAEFIDLCARAVVRPEEPWRRAQRAAEARANAWDVRATEFIAALETAGWLAPQRA